MGEGPKKKKRKQLEAERQCSLSTGVNDTQRGGELSEPFWRTKLQKAYIR